MSERPDGDDARPLTEGEPEPPQTDPEPPQTDPEPPQTDPELLNRLDPDRAGAELRAADRARRPPAPPTSRPPPAGAADAPLPSPVIDTRPYRWMIGIFGLVLVVGISIYQFATNGVGTTGVPPGQRLHYFAAPLANTNLNGDPNLDPPCTLALHDPRALNICLIARSRPLVLTFFVIGSGECEAQVDALQQLSARFGPRTVQFAAVAVHASHSATAALIRSRHWTIPIAYDRDGSVGGLYGVAVCPMVELAYRGGTVKDRLIGDQWQTAAELEPRVQALLRGRPASK